jgi:hypothetical protein
MGTNSGVTLDFSPHLRGFSAMLSNSRAMVVRVLAKLEILSEAAR